MSLREVVASGAVGAAASLAIVAVTLVAFLSLPESLVYNDYVFGAVLGGTIVLVSGVVRVAHPDAGSDTVTPRER
jgi:hypothetical protein